MTGSAVSIFLPIYNEESVIEDVVTKATEFLTKNLPDYELILVNDGSTDNTLAILTALAKKNKKIKVVDHVTNKGYGEAIKSGIKHAAHDWVFFMDSDGQFELKSLESFLTYMGDADFVIGYRETRNDKKTRLLLAKVYRFLVKLMFGLKVTDIDCAFKLMKKERVNDLNIQSSSFFVSTELLCKAKRKGHKIVELPVKHYPRAGGKSSVTLKRSAESLMELLKLFKTIRYT